MPMKPITVKANFQLDTSAARQQLGSLKREISSLTNTSALKLGVTEQITEAIHAAQILKQTLNEATDFRTGAFDLSKFTAAMNQNMMSIEKFRTSLQTLGPEGEKAFNSLTTTIASAQVPLKRTSEGMSQFVTAFGNTMRWQATSMAIHKVVGTISEAYNYAQNLDKSLNHIQIVTGHNTQYMKDFAVQANKAAQALSASTLEYTNAALIYYQQGLSDKEVSKRVDTTLKMAKVSGESASKVSQQMTAVWNNFSNGVDNLERYADVMTALGATTASSSSEIAKGLEKFASVTKTIGLSYDYAASALATVTAQTRQSADSVGTAFKTLFSRLESLNLGETLEDDVTLNKYSEALLKVGVNVMDANGKLKDMDTILDELGERWNNLNKAQQVALAQTVGGVRNYTSLITLMDNWESFQKNVTTAQMAEGTLQKQADIYATSWEAAQQRVKTASQGIYNTLISSDFFKGFNNVLAGTLNTINDLGKSLGTVGSVAGLSMLFNTVAKDKISSFIEDKAVNLIGNTAYGIRQQTLQQQSLIQSAKTELLNSGLPEDANRLALIETQQSTWKDFSTAQRNGYFNSKIEEQSYYNQLVNANMLSTEASNKLIDATTAVQDNFVTQATVQGQTLSLLGQIETDQSKNQYLWNNTLATGIQAQGKALGELESFSAVFNRDIQTFLASSAQSKSELDALTRIQGNMKNYVDASGNFLLNDKTGFGQSFYQMFSSGQPINKDILRTEYSQYIASVQSQNIAGQVISDLRSGGYDISQEQERQITASINKGVQGYQAEAFKKMDSLYSSQAAAGLYGNIGSQIPTGTSENDKSYKSFILSQQQKLDAYAQAGLNKQGQVGTISFGNAAISTAQMLNSVAMASNSLKNFSTSVKEGNVNFTQLIGTIGSTGLAVGQLGMVLNNTSAVTGLFTSNFGKHMANQLGASSLLQTLGLSEKAIIRADAGVGKMGEIMGLSGLGFALPVVGALAAAGAGLAGYKILKANSLDSTISRANENQIAMSAKAKEDQQKQAAFTDVMNTQLEAVNKLPLLQQGTAAYTSQLLSANNTAREIIDAYNLKAGVDYSINTAGAITFSSQQIANINEQLLETSKQSDNLAQLSKSQYNQLQYLSTTYDLQEEKKGLKDIESTEYFKYKTDEERSERLTEIDQELANTALLSQADFQTAIASTLNTYESITDQTRLGADILGLQANKLAPQYAEQLKQNEAWGGAANNIWGKYKSLEDLRSIYYDTFKEFADENMTQQQLAGAITAKATQNVINSMIEEATQGIDASMASEFSRYTSMSYNAVFGEGGLIDRTKDITNAKGDYAYDSLNRLALNKSFEAQNNLADAMLNYTNMWGIGSQSLFNQAGQLAEKLDLSIDQQNILANYMNNFGVNFGDATGQAIFDAMTSWSATDRTGEWNGKFYEELTKLSTSSNISALASLETRIDQLSRNESNRELVSQMRDLSKAMRQDINDRGGLAKQLFSSSDFAKVFDKLSETVRVGANITAENISDLAAKNDTLNAYLQATGHNYQAVADMANLIGSGRMSVEEMTPTVTNFIEQASSGGGGAQQKAMEDWAAALNLSSSFSEIDKLFKQGGVAWYTATKNAMPADAPLMEWMDTILSEEQKGAYAKLLAEHRGSDIKEITKAMKNDKTLAPVYDLLTSMQGKGKYKGKGNGGLDEILAFYQDTGIIRDKDAQGQATGFSINPDTGAIQFTPEFYENFHSWAVDKGYVKADEYAYQTEDRLTEYLSEMGFNGLSPESAKLMAEAVVGRYASDTGYIELKKQGFLSGMHETTKAMSETTAQSITANAFDQLMMQYGSEVAAADQLYWDAKTKTFIEADKITDEMKTEVFDNTERFKKVTNEKGSYGGIEQTDLQHYATEAIKAAGGVILDTTELMRKGVSQVTTSDIGDALVKGGRGTFESTGGADAFIEAARKSGVTVYTDRTQKADTYAIRKTQGHGEGGYVIRQTGQGENAYAGKSFDYNELHDFYVNTLGRSESEFEQNLSDIANGLTTTTNGIEHKGAINYQYKDAFGNIRNINSRNFQGENGIDVGEFKQAIDKTEQQREVDEMAKQRMADTAYDRYTKARDSGELDKEGGDFQNWTYEDFLNAEYQDYQNRQRQAEIAENGYYSSTTQEERYAEGNERINDLQKQKNEAYYGNNYEKANDLQSQIEYETQLNEYQNNMTATERKSFQEQVKEKYNNKEALTPFEKQVLASMSDITDNQELQQEIMNDEASGKTGANGKTVAGVDEETGELLDEEGNPIEMPESQQRQQSSSGGGDTTAKGSGGKGKTEEERKAEAKEKTQKAIDEAKANGASSVTVDSEGNVTGTTYNLDDKNSGGSDSKVTGDVKLSSGQNNHTLNFAAGKEGHIAMTGELGPELRIKADGSADMLGKKGREYAWVEPSDRIYTAAQTQSIMSNNNIPELIGLSTGINNIIPGYEVGNNQGAGDITSQPSSSGGGSRKGGGSGSGATDEKDPRYDPNTLKLRDILERYYTILNRLDDITRAVENFAKVADRAWGEDRTRAIERQTELYKEQAAAQNQYLAEIKQYRTGDKDTLDKMIKDFISEYNDTMEGKASIGGGAGVSGFGNLVYMTSAGGGGAHSITGIGKGADLDPLTYDSVQYDQNGVITNYDDIVKSLTDQYNANAEANAQDPEAQYKFQERLKDIQFYTESLNLYEEQLQVLKDLRNTIQDNKLSEVQSRIEYKRELQSIFDSIETFEDTLLNLSVRTAPLALSRNLEKMNEIIDVKIPRELNYAADVFAVSAGAKAKVGGEVSLDKVQTNKADQNKIKEYENQIKQLEKEIKESDKKKTTDATISYILKSWGDTPITNHERIGEYLTSNKKESSELKSKEDQLADVKKKLAAEKAKNTTGVQTTKIGNTPPKQYASDAEYKKEIASVQKQIKEIENKRYQTSSDKEKLKSLQNSLKTLQADRKAAEAQRKNGTNLNMQISNEPYIMDYLKKELDNLKKNDVEAYQKIMDKYGQVTAENQYEVAHAINEANARLSVDLRNKLLHTYDPNLAQEFWDTYSKDMIENLTTPQVRQIEQALQNVESMLKEYQSKFEQIFKYMGAVYKQMNKDLSDEIDNFDFFRRVSDYYLKFAELTEKQLSGIDEMGLASLRELNRKNDITKIQQTREMYDNWLNFLNEEFEYEYKVFDENTGEVIRTDKGLQSLKARRDEEERLYKQYEKEYNDLVERMKTDDTILDSERKYLEDLYTNHLNSWENLDSTVKQAEKQLKDYEVALYQALEDALQNIKDTYEYNLAVIQDEFEKNIGGIYLTLQGLMDQYQRLKDIEDSYVDDYQRIHDLSKLNRDLEKSILDTDNLKSKQRLRDMQEEILALQESGVELSEYDLDILDKKYKLELARQALEDARDAKSIVRLSRDNNGNWGYVYSANQDDIDKAEQDYEDALNDMAGANENYLDNLKDSFLSLMAESKAALAALNPADYDSLEEYYAAVREIEAAYSQKIAILLQQMDNAYGNNKFLSALLGANNQYNLSLDIVNDLLGKYLGTDSLADFWEAYNSRLFNELINPMTTEFTKVIDAEAEAWATSQLQNGTINDTVTTAIETQNQLAEAQIETINDVYEDWNKIWRSTMSEILSTMSEYRSIMKYVSMLENIANILQLSGDYISAIVGENEYNTIFEGMADTYADLQSIQRALQKYGFVEVIENAGTAKENITRLNISDTKQVNEFFNERYKTANQKAAKQGNISLDKEKMKSTDIDQIKKNLSTYGKITVEMKDKDGNKTKYNLVNGFSKTQELIEEWERKAKINDSMPNISGGLMGAYSSVLGVDTGGYTGRWQSADTGMYTGEWPNGSVRTNGRLALLHQKELVLNAHDTENFLDAMEIVRQLDNLASWMSNGLGDLINPKVAIGGTGELEQNVHIEASFPNVTDHNEIEKAFDNLVNLASQYANKKTA